MSGGADRERDRRGDAEGPGQMTGASSDGPGTGGGAGTDVPGRASERADGAPDAHPHPPDGPDSTGTGPVTTSPSASVTRWSPLTAISTATLFGLIAALFAVPTLFGPAVVQRLTSLLILVLLAVMWNALAGYAGLVSVGQQAFIGIGAYSTIYLTHHGVGGYLAMGLSALVAGVIAVPTSFLVLRLRGGEFAIAMWVVAEVFRLLVSLNGSLGGGTGISLTALGSYDPVYRLAYTYWFALAVTGAFVFGLFLLLRGRAGTSLRAIRDDQDAAASVGVRVLANKRLIFLLTSVGCGAAGSMILANTLFIQPNSIFEVRWTAYMIFMVLVGGLGTFEGPILGALVLFGIQVWFGDGGVWYLVGLGAVAALFAVLLPRGLWGTVVDRFGIRLLPIGYRVNSPSVAGSASAQDDGAPRRRPGDHLLRRARRGPGDR